MAVTNLIGLGGKSKTISLSTKTDNIIRVDDNEFLLAFEKSGNNLNIHLFEKENPDNKVATYTLKNFAKFKNEIKFQYDCYYTDTRDEYRSEEDLRTYLDTKGFVYTGNPDIEKKQTIKGSGLNDVIMGGNGNDKLYSNGGNDVIFTHGGKDTIYAGENQNNIIVSGEFGTKTIYLKEGSYSLLAFYNEKNVNIADAYQHIEIVTENDITLSRPVGTADLHIFVDNQNGTNGTIVLKNYFNIKDKTFNLLLNDDSTWTELKSYAKKHYGDDLTTSEFVDLLKNSTLIENQESFKNIITNLSNIETSFKNDLLILGKEDAPKGQKLTDSYTSETIIGSSDYSDKITLVGGLEDTINLNGGNNTVSVTKKPLGNVTINELTADDGKNTISLGHNAVVNKIELGNGNNKVYFGNEANVSNIDLGNGDNTVKFGNRTENAVINLGDGYKKGNTVSFGKDTREVTVTSGIAKDKVTISSNSVVNEDQSITLNLSDGNNTVSIGKNAGNYDSNSGDYGVNITTGSGADTISISDYLQGAKITTGAGKDTIKIGKKVSGKIEIQATEGNEEETKKVTIGYADVDAELSEVYYNANGSNSNNTVSIGSNYKQVNVVGGNAVDKITLGSNIENATITTGDGDDTVVVGKNTQNLTIDLGIGENKLTIGNDSGDYYDEKSDDEKYSIKIKGSYDGKDTITLGHDCEGVLIGADADAECWIGDKITIGNDAEDIKITAGSDSTIKIGKEAENVSIYTGEGDNIITLSDSASKVIIDTANYKNANETFAKDTITIGKNANDITISTDAGDDKITVGSTKGSVTINAGLGNDVIKSSAMYNEINFDEEFGEDTITLAKGSKTKLNFSGTQNTIIEHKKDLILYNEETDSKLTIKDFKTSTHKNSEVIMFYGMDYSESTESQEINLSEDNNNIKVSYDIKGSSYADTINVGTSNCIIEGGAGDDSIISNSEINTINFNDGYGNDTITLKPSSITNLMYSNDSEKYVLYHKSDLIFVDSETGEKTIIKDYRTDEHSSTIVNVYNNGIQQTSFTGIMESASLLSWEDIQPIETKNINITSYEFKVDADSDRRVVKGSSGDDIVTVGKNSIGINVFGNEGDDTITVEGTANPYIDDYTGRFIQGVEISGDSGDDKITVGSLGKDAKISGGEGVDTITLQGSSETASVSGGLGNDIITVDKISNGIYVTGDEGDDTIMIKGTADSYVDSNENIEGANISGGLGNDTIEVSTLGNKGSIYGGDDNDIITVGQSCESSYIDGGFGDDTITVTSNLSQIIGDDGDDTITVKEMQNDSGYIQAGYGDDTVIVEKTLNTNTKAKIYLNDGDDKAIIGENSKMVHIDCGWGADEVTIGAGSSSVGVDGGYGDDVITIEKDSKITSIYGEEGDDRIIVNENSTTATIYGGAGDDYIYVGANSTDTFISGGNSDGAVSSGDGNDTIISYSDSNQFEFSMWYDTDTITLKAGSQNRFDLDNGNFNVYVESHSTDLILVDEGFGKIIIENYKTTAHSSTLIDLYISGVKQDKFTELHNYSNAISGQAITLSDSTPAMLDLDSEYSTPSNSIDINGYKVIGSNYADTINVDLDDSKKVLVGYTDGMKDDNLVVVNRNVDDLNVFFDVDFDYGTTIENSVKDSLYIVSSITKDNVDNKGIEIEGYISGNQDGWEYNNFGGVTVYGYTADKTLNTNAINEIIENVQSWLAGTSYTSAYDALSNGTADEVAQLVACYTPTENTLWTEPVA